MSGAIRRKPDPKKHCLHCGQRLRRKRFDSKLESMNVFIRRKYCDLVCSAAGQVKPEVTKGAYLWRARKLRKPECEECGSTENLHAHHKDENWKNNVATNIETLCGSCHLKLHWSKGQHRPAMRWVRAEALEQLVELAEAQAVAAPPEEANRIRDMVRGLWSKLPAPPSPAAQLVRMIDE